MAGGLFDMARSPMLLWQSAWSRLVGSGSTCPANDLARRLIAASRGGPLVTSANLSARPDATTAPDSELTIFEHEIGL
jgi:tRNA A37 threonylcarbamoyladenosine synthetase subunit TsaC/SUA5/YrdC